MRNSTFGELQKALSRTYSPSAADAILIHVGRACGKRSALRLKTTAHNEADLLTALVELKNEERWCSLSYEGLSLTDKRGKIIAENSFEAQGYGQSDAPVCWFLEGYLEGALSEISGATINLTQTECAAKGDQRCVFQIAQGGTTEHGSTGG